MPNLISPDSSNKFVGSLVGRSYEQIDCWNLVREFYLGVFGIELQPYYSGPRPSMAETDSLIKTNRGSFEKAETPKFGDLMLMRIRGMETHIAVYLSDTTFLHSIKGVGSCVERIDKWKNCIVGYYRHRSTAP